MLYFCILMIISYCAAANSQAGDVLVTFIDGQQKVRLVDESTVEKAGRLELYNDGEWNLLCSVPLIDVDAIDACFRMNYRWLGKTINVTNKPIVSDFKCTAKNQPVSECRWGSQSCRLINAASKSCRSKPARVGISQQRVCRWHPVFGTWVCGRTCFAADSTVYSADGRNIKMSDLKSGDQVLTVDMATGVTRFDKVLSFLHRDTNTATEFLVIETKSGHEVTISADHLIFASPHPVAFDEHTLPEAVFAKDVHIGDYVFVTEPTTAIIQKPGQHPMGDEVIRVTSVVKEGGAYAPLTASGTIVVDGVTSSCYASFSSHNIAHASMAPLRMCYYFSEWLGLSDLREEPLEDDRLHWYAKTLINIVEFMAPSSFGVGN